MFTTLLSLVALGSVGQTQSLDLKPVGHDATQLIGGYIPQRLALGALGADAHAAPGVSPQALYGTLSFGGKALAVAVDFKDGKPARLLVDAKGTGDFVDDAASDFTSQGSKDQAGTTHYVFFANVSVPGKLGDVPLSVKMYMFDPTDATRSSVKNTLLYYGDYAMEGQLNVGGKSFKALLWDTTSSGQYSLKPTTLGQRSEPGVFLMIDRDGDGRFDQQFETFDASKPFNLDGTTYVLKNLTPGGVAELAKSATKVAEIPIPKNFHAGDKVASFEAKDRDGKLVHFPQDFKGKVVMLDFWATWCGPCMGEVPNVVKTYNATHAQGFDILGISLDNADTIKNITSVTQQQGMTWDQIADGKYWDAAVAKLYNIQSIPHAFLVDGTTGKIIAEGDGIRGDNLLPAVQKALGEAKAAK